MVALNILRRLKRFFCELLVNALKFINVNTFNKSLGKNLG